MEKGGRGSETNNRIGYPKGNKKLNAVMPCGNPAFPTFPPK